MIECRGIEKERPSRSIVRDDKLFNKRVDVLVIGAGVVGCATARELSKYKMTVLVVDKESDIAMHQSSRNAGMAHPPIAPKPGSKKALYNERGLKILAELSKELDFPYEENGMVILFKHWIFFAGAGLISSRAKKNGIESIEFLSKKRLKSIESNVFDDFAWACLFKNAGIVDPFKMTLAFAENAVQNGVEFSFQTFVESIEVSDGKILSVETNRGRVFPRVVVNAAGLWADYVAELANDRFFTIHPRKGEMAIIDSKRQGLVRLTISMPQITQAKSVTKGGGLIPTVHGNLLLGPTAKEVPFKEDYSTTSQGLEELIKKHAKLVHGLTVNDIITYFAGTRAATYREDFIVEKSRRVRNLVHAAGIQSPGLTSAPAIAQDVAKMCVEILSEEMHVLPNTKFVANRRAQPPFKSLSLEEKQKLIEKDPNYGVVVCRCEEVTKAEIIKAVSSPLPATTLDGVKWRTRCGMGRCQGGFCTPYVLQTLQQQRINVLNMTKKGGSSYIVVGKTRGE
ncbi:NAD(P)/FAD-dependent oxidoreductase [Pseudothermotoga sp. U03pept]|uniref:NAD(P)/FAD-dependent oxidoreductase n=1 Tax=Pseudothermotoga sp. U03pept TaxID=3447012 RepID=UPI003EFEA534